MGLGFNFPVSRPESPALLGSIVFADLPFHPFKATGLRHMNKVTV